MASRNTCTPPFQTVLSELTADQEDQDRKPVVGAAIPMSRPYAPEDELTMAYREHAGDTRPSSEIQDAYDKDPVRHLLDLRRRAALAAHPDRVSPELRERATEYMSHVNALVDEALARLRSRR